MRVEEENQYGPEEYSNEGKDLNNSRRADIFRFCGCGLAAIFLIIVIIFITIRSVVGPAITKLDGVPDNFPKDIALYQPDQAKVKLQNQVGREKTLDLLKKAPDWALPYLWKFLSENNKKQLLGVLGQAPDLAAQFSIDDFKTLLDASTTDATLYDTVSLSWNNLDKGKQDLLNYYKEILSDNDFQFEEKISDYKINLDFWKEGVFGTASLQDEKFQPHETKMDMIVNYLK